MMRLIISLVMFSSCLIAVITTVLLANMEGPSHTPDVVGVILSGNSAEIIGASDVWSMFAVVAAFCSTFSLLWVIRELSLLVATWTPAPGAEDRGRALRP
jgi:hypothetical protein